MSTLAGAALGALLLLSGALKVRNPRWPVEAAAFGAPRWAVPVLPWAELVLGALLAAGVGRPWTALAVAALLAAFTVAVAVRVVQGRRVPCACFGGLAAGRVGPGTVARNAVLVGVALVAAL